MKQQEAIQEQSHFQILAAANDRATIWGKKSLVQVELYSHLLQFHQLPAYRNGLFASHDPSALWLQLQQEAVVDIKRYE